MAQARAPTFVCLFRDDATSANGPGCDEGTNLRLRDFAVVPLMPTREMAILAAKALIILYILSFLLSTCTKCHVLAQMAIFAHLFKQRRL